jgi:hypothetical protein
MVYKPLATGLLDKPLATAIAESVSVVPTETGAVYLALAVVGLVPSVV